MIILIIVIAGGYHLYDRFFAVKGAFDDNGNPKSLVFTFNECGKPCDDAIKLLEQRGIDYDNINLSDGKEQLDLLNQHGGGSNLPVFIIGENRVDSYFKARITAALAEAYGEQVLTQAENRAMDEHFDSDGNPVLVMYATKTCGYCIKAARYFDDIGVEYITLDIDDDQKARKDYETLQATGTPLIYVGFRRIEGFNKKAVDRALELL